MLSKFLNKELGIPADVARAKPALWNNAISDDSFEKWRAYIKKLDL